MKKRITATASVFAVLFVGVIIGAVLVRFLPANAGDLDPSAPVYALLGDLCDANGNRNEAARAMEQAVRLDPANPRYRQRMRVLSRSP